MPESGLYVTHCDLPIWIDSYRGCSYNCGYCLERINGRKTGDPVPRHGHGVTAVRSFMDGVRTVRTSWCDWDIPLHWGVSSEGFQPCELEYRSSYALLKLFAETNYPVVISTKSVLLSMGQYIELLGECNAVVQVSMVSPALDAQESGPSYRHRFCSLYKLSRSCKRLLIRVQPFMLEDLAFIQGMLRAYSASGVYGLIVEGLKRTNWVYDVEELLPALVELRERVHEAGLFFFSGENRLRYLGDSLNCCGTDGLSGFRCNRSNLNYKAALRVYTPSMRTAGTAGVFQTSRMSMDERETLRSLSFMEAMEGYGKNIGLG